jgi:hypothetical protein
MDTRKEEKKRYEKPEVRRVELSLAEAVLATSCSTIQGDDMVEACGPTGNCMTD